MAHPVVESIKRKFFDFEDFLFEKWHGIDVRGVITNENLVTPDLDRRNHATAYHAVWCRNLRALLAEAAKTGNSFENFVDVGSGKGKACLYAHFRKSFQKIIGVEFSTPLVEIANRNRDKRFPAPGRCQSGLPVQSVRCLCARPVHFQQPGSFPHQSFGDRLCQRPAQSGFEQVRLRNSIQGSDAKNFSARSNSRDLPGPN